LQHNYSKLRALRCRELIAIDTEYVAHPGEHVIPVCVCAKSLFTGKTWRIWHSTGSRSPFKTNPETIYIAYSATAEWSYFLSCGWDLPRSIIDLYPERSLEINGRKEHDGTRPSRKLLGAMEAHGIRTRDDVSKDLNIQLILRGAPYTAQERERILDYCIDDVEDTIRLFDAMLPSMSVEHALCRGGFTRAVAHVEYNGIPMDRASVTKLKAEWPRIMRKLAAKTERRYGYGVYDLTGTKPRFSMRGFTALLDRMGILDEWPKTAGTDAELGQPILADGHGKDGRVFKDMCGRYPELEPLRVLRGMFVDMKEFNLPIGKDGRARTFPFPWASVTGRNQPGRGFIYGQAKWTRFLIKPASGRAIAYLDLKSAEFGIAAALSGDVNMMAAYQSDDDVYLATAKLTGAVPQSATKQSHASIRTMYKVATLGMQYGMTAWGLVPKLGITESEARRLIDGMHRVYRTYFHWIDDLVPTSQALGEIAAPMGWTLHVDADTNPRTLKNFPMQTTCGEILRLATDMMVDRGINLCAMVHDAVLVEASLQEIDWHCQIATECWTAASKTVLDGFELKSDCVITRYPRRYFEEDGKEMWDRVRNLIAA
jgi:DNA polymerase I